MPMVELLLQVEETHVFPVIRVLKGLPGVGDVTVDLDKLDLGKRKRKPRGEKLNGHASRPPRPEGGLTVLLLAHLYKHGPSDLTSLKRLLTATGFAESSINSALHDLRNKGLTETGGPGIHKLTEKAMADMQQGHEPEPQRALPPPEKLSHASPLGASLSIIIKLLQESPTGQTSRAVLIDAIEKNGFSPRSVDGALERGRDKGFIKIVDKGVYQLTAKGKRFEIPPAA